ncbi:putative C2 domain protein [Trichinella nativa]|uniref:Putative C2 domain protein n=1 Tax=Trichinella nativa TaxID=6335 RepID=A0A1Y3EJU6_9BILA|nr:putative C2 domain protein [Trichinella nativa]
MCNIQISSIAVGCLFFVIKKNDPGRLPNPYVKAYLLQERHHYCRSRIHKKTENAEFNEVFSFEAPIDGLSSRMLQLTVYDYERIKRHDIIGNVIMRDLLEKSDLSSWTEYTMHVVDNDVSIFLLTVIYF